MNHVKSALFPFVAVLLVLAAWGLQPGQADEPADASRAVAVTQSTYACPAGSVITVASGQVNPGTSRTVTALPSGATDSAFGDATAWQRGVVKGTGAIVDQRGESAGAVGFFAGKAPKAGGGGLVVGECPGLVDDAWFLGLGSGAKHFSTLILTNLGDTPAAVDLTLWGSKGRIEAVKSEGVVIEPRSVRRIRLDDLAAGERELAVKVHRRQGAISVVANDSATATFSGTEPASATVAPSREQVVGGLVKGASGRTLLVLNPGTATARVSIKVIGRKGTVSPTGLDDLQVKAGVLQSIEIPASAGADEQALRITSDQPVSTTVRMAPSTKDYAYAEATTVLSGPAVVPVDVGVKVGSPRLLLTAPGKRATVELQAFDSAMKLLSAKTVTIAAGTTQGLDSPDKSAAYLVLRPKGDVIAAATYTDGDSIASLALTGAPLTTRAPQVRPHPQR